VNGYTIRPLEELIEDITVEVNEVVKQRELFLTDFDSYRRRIKACKEKIDKIQSTSPVNQSQLDAQHQEMTKLQAKYLNAETHYNEYNLQAKTLLKDSRRKILGYVEKHVVTSLTCQVSLTFPSLSSLSVASPLSCLFVGDRQSSFKTQLVC
jgi:predicted nuclease with TOPRIM domain